MTICIDCGGKATGERCRACRAKYDLRLAARLLNDRDVELLRMRDTEHLSLASMGRRLGVSRPSVQMRLRRARTRQKALKDG